MNTSAHNPSVNRIFAGFAVARMAFGSIAWQVRLFLAGFLLIPFWLVFSFAELRGLPGAISFIVATLAWFILLANYLNRLAAQSGMRLLPGFPGNFAWAAALLCCLISLIPALVFLPGGLWLYITVTGWNLACISLVLCMANHKRSSSRLVLMLLVFAPWISFIEIQFGSIRSASFQVFYAQHQIFVTFVPFFMASVLFGFWFRWLGYAEIRSTSTNMLWGRLLHIIDLRATSNIIGKQAKTGYLLQPGFMLLSRLEQRPLWRWMNWALTDPGRMRANFTVVSFGIIFIGLAIIGVDPGKSLSFEVVLLGLISLQPIDELHPMYVPWLRRLYLQSPVTGRVEFRKQVVKLRYYGFCRTLLLMFPVIWLEQWWAETHRLGLLLIFGVLAYFLSLSVSMWMVILGLEGRLKYGLAWIGCWVVTSLGYMRIADEHLTLWIWRLVAVVLAGGFSWLTMQQWTRADTEM
ncbi:MAG: hypothetical protein WD772_02940 [Pseudohongiellaceae bacterium]